ncbi:MAG TPA: hypothetical protein VJT31_17455 [Rugosimonospora sp.]|nr:hypothetical protein [Rugosimonospora sp.]
MPTYQATRRSDLPLAEGELDLHLQRTVRRTSWMRQGFYVVVLLVALAGQVSGAVETLHIPLIAAIPAVGALELGGIVVLANADVRRRLGERAVASRLLSVAIAAGAVAFNWLAHANHLMGGFFAGMSALGYLVWLMHTENQRRDRLRAKGDLPPTTPAYEVVGHWLMHPWLTRRARTLAKANPELGLYESLHEARAQVRRRRQQAAISKVLHRKIRAAVDPTTADIAIAVYDLDEIATRLATGADYDGLTALIAADLAPAKLAASLGVQVDPAPEIEPAPAPAVERAPDTPTLALPAAAPEPEPEPVAAETEQALLPDVRRELGALLPTRRQTSAVRQELDASRMPTDTYPIVTPASRVPAAAEAPAGRTRTSRNARAATVSTVDEPGPGETVPAQREPAEPTRPSTTGREGSLRRQVHEALDSLMADGELSDETELVGLVGDHLQLDPGERLAINAYVSSWVKGVQSRRRDRAAVAG